jgi:vitamin K-dependent gamma-carboxylase
MISTARDRLRALKFDASAPVPIESLAALRIIFGIIMAVGTTRFLLSGWVSELFIKPTFFFKYLGFGWMPVWGPVGLYIHFGVVIIAALMVAAGWYYRIALSVFMLSFLGIQLFDASNYLNHYYLVLCISIVLLFLPANAAWSLDVMRGRLKKQASYPALGLWLLRFQVGIVYGFAAVAKLGSDWILHAQPLSIWLSARQDLPILGTLFASPYTAYAMSWGGLVYDATIVIFLLWRRTRGAAYLAVLGFHGMTFLLFDIGMFPVIMVGLTTIFFDPKYPRRIFNLKAVDTREEAPKPVSSRTLWLVCTWCLFHFLFPFRQTLSDSNVLWSEQGMRYSWRVMVREKMGSITYLVTRTSDRRVWEVNPLKYLEPRQLSEMSGQPEMIRQLAFHIKDDFESRHKTEVQVRVRALVSLNGRTPALLIDPNIDLTGTSANNGRWVLQMPTDPPLTPWGQAAKPVQRNQ